MLMLRGGGGVPDSLGKWVEVKNTHRIVSTNVFLYTDDIISSGVPCPEIGGSSLSDIFRHGTKFSAIIQLYNSGVLVDYICAPIMLAKFSYNGTYNITLASEQAGAATFWSNVLGGAIGVNAVTGTDAKSVYVQSNSGITAYDDMKIYCLVFN